MEAGLTNLVKTWSQVVELKRVAKRSQVVGAYFEAQLNRLRSDLEAARVTSNDLKQLADVEWMVVSVREIVVERDTS